MLRFPTLVAFLMYFVIQNIIPALLRSMLRNMLRNKHQSLKKQKNSYHCLTYDIYATSVG